MRLAGVFPPITTPFKDDRVDLRALAENLRRWLSTSVSGVVVLGSNGEAPFLSEEESYSVVAGARENVASDRLLIAGAGRESTRLTIQACRDAARAGADAVLVRTPSFFRTQMTTEVFVQHYEAVAAECPVPVVLYNFAAIPGVNLTPDAVERLTGHPNIIGVKDSSGEIGQITDLVMRTPDDFDVVVWAAPVFYPSLVVGARGGVIALACVVPDLCVRLVELVSRNRHDEALALQRQLTPLARLVTTTYGVAGLKAALDLVGYVGGLPRRPLQPITADALAQIRQQLLMIQGAVV